MKPFHDGVGSAARGLSVIVREALIASRLPRAAPAISTNNLTALAQNQQAFCLAPVATRVKVFGMRWFLLLLISASAVWAQPLVAPAMVSVPDPGNYGTTGSGSAYGGGLGFVRHKFFVSAYEVSNDDYCRFLNAVDPFGANALLLYSASMAASPSGGIGFNSEAPAGARYSTLPNMADKPVNYVSWLDAARFCNWINNGATATASTELGAYDLSGPSATNATRLPGAVWFLPSENEWFKAAYGYPTGLPTAKYDYFVFATGSTYTPTAVFANSVGQGPGSSGNSANFNKRANWNGSTEGNVTSIGGNGGPSFYGAFDIDGNVSEWTDTQPALGQRVVRGGNFSSTTINRLVATNAAAGTEAANIGFRIARMSDSSLVRVADGQLPLSYSYNLNDRDVGPFYIDKYELTASEFYVVASWAATNGYDIGAITDFSTSQVPIGVTLDTAMKWCDAKSQLEGLTPFYRGFKKGTAIPSSPNYEADGYRLPTDAEWEWAARGGLLSQDFTYSGSNDRSAVATTSLTNVGTLAPNELGLYDLTGNAREWTGSRHWNNIWFFARFGDPLSAREGWPISTTMGFRIAKNVPRAPQTLTAFAEVPTKTFGNLPFQIAKPVASSGLYVELSVLSGPARWSSDTTLSLTGAGTVVVAANQAGNNYYFPAEQITTSFTVAQAQQSIGELLPIHPKEFPAAPFTISAPSATSSLPVVLTIKSGPATISGATISLTGAGTVVVAANQAGDGNYSPAPEVTTSFNVTAAKQPQNITFEQPAAQVYAPNQTFALSASNSSGQPVSFLSGDTNILTIVGNSATMRGAGSVAITATNTGSADFLPGGTTRTVAIEKGSQLILPFASTNNVPVGAGLTLTNTNSSAGLPVSFSLVSGPATVASNLVTVTGVGTVVLRAIQDGDNNFNSAISLTNRFTTVKGPQSIQPFGTTNNVPFGTSLIFTNTNTSAGLRVTFERVSGPVTVTSNRATITGIGAVVVRAIQAGDTNYNAASPRTNQFTSIKASQAITFNAFSNQVFAPKRTFKLTATSSSGLPVRFTSLNTNVITISKNVATLRGAGTATIQASQPGNANFNAALPIDQELTVAPAPQAITFNQPVPRVFAAGRKFRLTATSSSRLPVTFESGDESVLTIVGNVATIHKAGNAPITARQTGNANYAPAQDVTWTQSVTKANQSIRPFAKVTTKTFGAEPFDVKVPTATSGLPVVLSVKDGPATLDGNKVTLIGAGTVVLAANQTGDANFSAAREATTSFKVKKQNVAATVVVGNLSHTFDGASKAVTVETQPPGLSTVVTYRRSTSRQSSTSFPVDAGNYSVTAVIDDANHQGSKSATMVIAKADQTINFNMATDHVFVANKTFSLSATASSGLPITFSSLNRSVVSVAGNIATIKSPGQVVLQASNRGNVNYKPVAASIPFTIGSTADLSTMVTVQGGTLTRPFELVGTLVPTFHIGKYEVTWDKWQEIRDWAVVNGYSDLDGVGGGSAKYHPVRHVNWYDVVKWCNARSEKEGLTPVYRLNGEVYRTGQSNPVLTSGANGYRLPTLAEWVWSAQGGTSSRSYSYSGSNDVGVVGWYWDNSSSATVDQFGGRGTWPVGQKAPNELGIYDMSGNVYEWLEDVVGGVNRRLTGGSWRDPADNLKVGYDASSGWTVPHMKMDYGWIGFRCARNAP